MSTFLEHAKQLLATARKGGEDCRLSILVGRDGAIQVVEAAGWELEPLRRHHGARAAYRVTRTAGAVQVEGRSDEGSCVLRPSGDGAAERPAADFPRYLLSRELPIPTSAAFIR